MYNNIMTKFKWGGMEVKGTYLDNVFISSCALNIRQRCGSLANALIDEGKKDKAIKLLDKCLEVTPEENVPYDMTMYGITMAYYQAGAFEKGNALAKKLFDNYESNIRYYYSFDRRELPRFGSDVEQATDILRRFVYFTKNFKQDALSKEFETRFAKLENEFQLPTDNQR